MNSLVAIFCLAFAIASASVIPHAPAPLAALPYHGGALLKGPSFSSVSVGPDGSSISSVEDSGAVEVGSSAAVGYAAPAVFPPPPAPVGYAAPAVLPPPPAPVAYAAPAVLPPPPPASVSYSASTVYHPPPAPVPFATRAYIPPPPVPAPVSYAAPAALPPPPAPVAYAAGPVFAPHPVPAAYAGPVPTGTLIDGPSGRIETSGSAVGVIAQAGHVPWSPAPAVEARIGW